MVRSDGGVGDRSDLSDDALWLAGMSRGREMNVAERIGLRGKRGIDGDM
jgi:hypothetical protein